MTGRPGPTPEDFEDLRHIGDELQGELREAFLRMVGSAERYAEQYAGTPDLLQLVRSGNSAAVYAYAERLVSHGLIPNSLDFLNVMLAIMMRAGNATYASTALSLPLKDSIIETIRQYAMTRGPERGGQWVTNISRETVVTMRDIMTDALKRGVGAEQLGREFRGSIGLLPSHRVAWDNYNELLRAEKVSEKTFDRLSRMYYRRLLAYRAENISRTEAMFAVHEGQMLGWIAQVNAGLLQPWRTWIEWVVTEDDRLCDRCAPMDGQRLRMDGKAQLGSDGKPRLDEHGRPLPGNKFIATVRGFPDGRPPNVDSPYDRRMARRGPLRPRIPVKKSQDDLLIPLKEHIAVTHPPLHPSCRCTLRLRFDM